MRTRTIITLAVLFSFLLLTISYALIPHQPHYHGKSLSYWLRALDDLDRDDDLTWEPWETQSAQKSTNYPEAVEAIRQMGTNSLPYLVDALSGKDGPLKIKLLALVRSRSFVAFKNIPTAGGYQRGAALALHILGPTAKPVIPQLKKLLDESKIFDPGKQAAVALAGIGPEGWLVLTQAATNADWGVADCAIWALGSHRATVPGTTSALLHTYTNATDGGGALTAWALGEIGQDSGHVVPMLINGLHSPAVDIRWGSAQALAKFGTNALAAVPALLQAIKDPDSQVSKNAKDALYIIDPQAVAKAEKNKPLPSGSTARQ